MPTPHVWPSSAFSRHLSGFHPRTFATRNLDTELVAIHGDLHLPFVPASLQRRSSKPSALPKCREWKSLRADASPTGDRMPPIAMTTVAKIKGKAKPLTASAARSVRSGPTANPPKCFYPIKTQSRPEASLYACR